MNAESLFTYWIQFCDIFSYGRYRDFFFILTASSSVTQSILFTSELCWLYSPVYIAERKKCVCVLYDWWNILNYTVLRLVYQRIYTDNFDDDKRNVGVSCNFHGFCFFIGKKCGGKMEVEIGRKEKSDRSRYFKTFFPFLWQTFKKIRCCNKVITIFHWEEKAFFKVLGAKLFSSF